jgi:hypothetical protein
VEQADPSVTRTFTVAGRPGRRSVSAQSTEYVSRLTDKEIEELEQPYAPHPIAGH